MTSLMIYLLVNILSVNALLHESKYYMNKFAAFEKEYGKKYSSEEESERRLQIFSSNVDKIEKFNSEVHSFRMGINQFADMTFSEFKSRMLNKKYEPASKSKYPYKLNTTAPSSVDWRKKGVLSIVDNQGECGSCWSFATAEALQAFNAIKQNRLAVSYSKQQFIDCAWGEKNRGCDGGSASRGLKMAEKYDNLCTEEEYPYLGKDYHCSIKAAKCSSKNVQKSTIHSSFGEYDLKEVVAQQPVTAGIMVTDYLQHYEGGIYSGEGCPDVGDLDNLDINHDTVLVGYGSEAGKQYWIIRNSWGSDWGEGGYFRIVRTEVDASPGMCGVAIDNAAPLAESPDDFERDEDLVQNIDAVTITLIAIGSILGITQIVIFFLVCNCCCIRCYFGRQKKSCFC